MGGGVGGGGGVGFGSGRMCRKKFFRQFTKKTSGVFGLGVRVDVNEE